MITMRPGDAPFRNLALQFREALANSGDSPQPTTEPSADEDRTVAITEAVLRSASSGLIQVVQDAGVNPETSVLLLVDQFEELFRFRRQQIEMSKEANAASEASAFVDLLLATTKQSERPIYVVITMRSDFFGRLRRVSGAA